MEVYVLHDVYRDKCIVFSPENIEQKIRDYITKYSDTSDWTEEDWDEEFEALESENIKNKGILSGSKRLLEESNTNILQALKNAQEWFKISLIDISHLNDDIEIKKVIDLCVKKIILTKDGNILNLNIESIFGLNYYFSYNVKNKEIKFLDETIKLMVSVRYKSKRKRG